MELLPAQRDIPISYKRGAFSERTLRSHDAAIVMCDRNQAAALAELPYATLWKRAHEDAKRRGPVSTLALRVGEHATPIVVALTKPDAPAFERLTLAARAWKELQTPARARVAFATAGMNAAQGAAALEAMVTAALAATAPMPSMKSKALHTPDPAAFTVFHERRLDFARPIAIDNGNHLARWLTTLPPNVLDTKSYRRALRDLAQREGWQFSFLDEATLRRRSAGAFLAVSRANEHRDAGIVRLRYRSKRGKSRKRLALVGKGICFDTGGINLKTHKGMYQMHEDMQGSAVAVGTMLALAAVDAPYDIDCWLAITENQIGARAFRPQEVVRASNGVTIQVAHSDAEGRMVLADTLAIASREKPDLMIDFATLTGACVVALGDRYGGAFTNRDELRGSIEKAGRDSGERVWPFPMDEDYDGELDSSIADILQCTPDSKADHILAARFLNRFVPQDIAWIHLDLAASNRTGGLAHIPTDFTGFGVRFATTLLLDHDLSAGTP